MHLQDAGRAHDPGDRRDVAEEIEVELFIERRIDCSCRRDQDERVAVRSRVHDHVSGDIGAGARAVVDNERLTETLRQPLANQAREDVGSAPGDRR